MNRPLGAGVALILVIATLALGGCTSGMKSGTDTSTVWGYVSSPDKAQLEVAQTQRGVDTLVVARVLSPTDGWLVVNADVNGKPGMRVGLVHVARGESLNTKVPLKDLTTPSVIVALYADKGTAGTFDFDMMNREASPDRPFFVNGAELVKTVTVREYGVQVQKSAASLEASAQPGASGRLVVTHVTAPADAWIVVQLEKTGAAGPIVGLAHVRSGETSDVVVPLEPFKLTPDLVVTLHADKGDPGLFEYDMNDQINSKDQPYFIGADEVAIKVRVQ